MESSTAIKVSNLGKKYTIGKQKDASLRSTLTSVFKSAAAKGDDFWAIQNIDFEIKRGDVVGIIGKNGAGKSTLLKVLSQITKPTTGKIEINGRVASLLEVGTGFHPELTGRENIYLNGTILGMTRKEVKEKFDDIVAFSGVAQFIDTPVKHYSSGMYVRLAFSVAAHLEPEILIIDEVLAVGDAEFQKKCIGKMKDVANEGRTVIFVSHNMGAVQKLCTKSMLIESGEISFYGLTEDCIDRYLKPSNETTITSELESPYIKSVHSMGAEKQIRNTFLFNEVIQVEVKFQLDDDLQERKLGLSVLDSYKRKLFTVTGDIDNSRVDQVYLLEIPAYFLLEDNFSVDLAIFIPNGRTYSYLNDVITFAVIDSGTEYSYYSNTHVGSINAPCRWQKIS